MITSRSIDDLVIPARLRCVAHLAACKREGIDLLITCTHRDAEAQNALYAQGRSRAQLDAVGLFKAQPTPGAIVTNALGGDSMHQWKCAYDVVPLRTGKPIWNTSGEDGQLWQRVGELGEQNGLEWAGRWVRFREFPHFQFTHGLTIADFKAGKVIPQDA